MILLTNSSHESELRDRARDFHSRGHRSYILNTSRGDVCTVLDIGSDHPDIESIKGKDDSVTFFNPNVPYILASWTIKDTKTIIDVGKGVTIGGDTVRVIGGPCTVESDEQIMKTAEAVKKAGADILRGGAFKPRSSPYSFQGMGKEGLRLLRKAGDIYDMPVVTEVLDADDIPVICEYSDILQVGARNCQNYSLLKKLGRIDKPILLKRGMMTTIEEFLLSAEYILSEGNMKVILCERGIRTFENETRNTLDISAVPILKQKTHLPVIVDPSHAAGTWKIVEPLSMAAIAAGADGIMVEVHYDPEKAVCDGGQSLRAERFEALLYKLKLVSKAVKTM